MKLAVTITSQKFKNDAGLMWDRKPAELVDFTLAEITAAGDSSLIAGHLRALADSIDPANAQIPTYEEGN